MRKTLSICIIALAVVVTVSFVVSYFGAKALQNYEDKVQKDLEITENSGTERNATALDRVEEYVKENRIRLGIYKYERTEKEITAHFLSGVTNIFHPDFYETTENEDVIIEPVLPES